MGYPNEFDGIAQMTDVFVITASEQANIASWGRFGTDYAKHAIISQTDIHYGLCIPGERELNLLTSVSNKRMLDVGCGSGENVFVLMQMGARVIGLEPSSVLFERARTLLPQSDKAALINAAWGDSTVKMRAPFDFVIFIGSSEYMPLDAQFFTHLNKITSVGSTVLLARMHPFWTSLFLHETDKETIRCYFDSGREDIVRYGDMHSPFVRYHYSIAEIVARFSRNGWHLEHLVEPAFVPMERAPFYMRACYEDPVLVDRLGKIPMTLILTFRESHGGNL